MKNSKTKKILSILLAMIMVVGMIPASVVPVSATNTSTIDRSYGTGDNELTITGEQTITITSKDNVDDNYVYGLHFTDDVVINGDGVLNISINIGTNIDLPAGIRAIYAEKSLTITDNVQINVNVMNYCETTPSVHGIFAGTGLYVEENATLNIEALTNGESSHAYGISNYLGEISIDGYLEKNIKIDSDAGGACIYNYANSTVYNNEANGDITIKGVGSVDAIVVNKGSGIEVAAGIYNYDGTVFVNGNLEIRGCSDYAIRNLTEAAKTPRADIIIADANLNILQCNDGIGSSSNGIRIHNSNASITATANAIDLYNPGLSTVNESSYGLDISGGGTVLLKSLQYNAIVSNTDSSAYTGPVFDFNLLSGATLEIIDGTFASEVPIGYVKLHNYTIIETGSIDETNKNKSDSTAYATTPAELQTKFSSSAEEYCVEFIADGGAGEMEMLQGVTGEYIVPECTFQAPYGYFKAWSLNGKEILPGTVITMEDNITLVAVWLRGPIFTNATVNGEICNNGDIVGIQYKSTDVIELQLDWLNPDGIYEIKEMLCYVTEKKRDENGNYYTNRSEQAINVTDNGDNTYTCTLSTTVEDYLDQRLGVELVVHYYWLSGPLTTTSYSLTGQIVEIPVTDVNIKVGNPDDWNDSDLAGVMQTEGMEIVEDTWYKFVDGVKTEMEPDESFTRDEEYVYNVKIKTSYGYVRTTYWSEDVYINGEEATFVSLLSDGSCIFEKSFVARAKLFPIVEKNTYFIESGGTLDIEVSAIGKDVQYSWIPITAGAPAITGGNTNKITVSPTADTEGIFKYDCVFTDAYGISETETITVNVTKMGFKDIKPTPSAEQLEAGVSDYGYVTSSCVYFEPHELSTKFVDAGYTVTSSVTDYMNGEVVGTSEAGLFYDVLVPGEHEVIQEITVYDPDGNVYKEYSHTHKMYLTRKITCNVFSFGSGIPNATIYVRQNGVQVSTSKESSYIHSLDVPLGDFNIEVRKNGYKPRLYEVTLTADEEYTLDTELLRWGDANLDDIIDVSDYQQIVNKALSDDHKLDGSYEQSVMDWCEDGYIDVLDCAMSILCINGNALYSASLENEHYYTIESATLDVPVDAEGFGIEYEWSAPSGAPPIVEGTENLDTAQIYITPNVGYLGNTYTYTCKVNDRFFNETELQVQVTVESLPNLYAVTYTSSYEGISELPAKQYVKVGESITLPTEIPELAGYEFKYWYSGSDRMDPGDTYTPYQNTLIMPYMAKVYEGTLYSGYEGELFGTFTGTYGQYYYLPEMDYMPEGYVFYGWTDVEGSTEVKYRTNYRYTITGDVSFYPVIAKASEVTFTIYANDGTDQVIYETTLAEQGGSMEFTIPADFGMPLRTDYVCTGFVTNPDNGYYDIKYGPGSTIGSKPEGVVLYCYWELPNILQFEGGMEGVTGLPNSVSFESPQSYQITSWLTPYCEGYEFLYWEDEEGNQYRPEDYVVVQGITTLTAVWEKLDTENYEIWIAGQKVSKANPVVQCGAGTARVVEDEWGYLTLVLRDITLNGGGIYTSEDIDIEVYGNNTITIEKDEGMGISSLDGYLSFTGPGTLNINVKGDNVIGIKGLERIDYATVNVNAVPATAEGYAYGVTCVSGTSSKLTLDNGAKLTTTGTCGVYSCGPLRISKTSSLIAEGTQYGIYDITGILDAWGGYSSGSISAKGNVSAMYFNSSFGFPYHNLANSEAYYSTSFDGLNPITWDGDASFIDTPYETCGYKSVVITPKACTGEHTLVTYSGLEGNCEKDGLTDGVYCSSCGYISEERELIEATGHDYHTHNGKEPTCTEQGIEGMYTQCANCGEYQGEVTFIDANGHSWGEWILIDGTDTWYDEYGYGERQYVRFCNNCDESETTWYNYYEQGDTGSPNDWNDDAGGKPY